MGDNGTAYGIAQWRFDRQDKLKKKYPGPTNNYTTLNSQLNWIIDELNTNQFKPVLSALKEPSTTVDIATSIFDRKYEISNGASLEQRKLYAKDIYDKIQNKTFK